MARAIARHEDELGKVAAAVTAEEQRNPKLAQEMRDWEATVGDGMENPGGNEKPEAR